MGPGSSPGRLFSSKIGDFEKTSRFEIAPRPTAISRLFVLFREFMEKSSVFKGLEIALFGNTWP